MKRIILLFLESKVIDSRFAPSLESRRRSFLRSFFLNLFAEGPLGAKGNAPNRAETMVAAVASPFLSSKLPVLRLSRKSSLRSCEFRTVSMIACSSTFRSSRAASREEEDRTEVAKFEWILSKMIESDVLLNCLLSNWNFLLKISSVHPDF